ncbi:MAG: transcriptional repressor [Promethearchaeota archaeon]|nr:MAG: transcriptional repressor [Candidatus Lokiarchaeota archaeon]
MTNQRLEILNFLSQSAGHPTAEDIYDAVKAKLPRISKATVYNNLNFLIENDRVKMVDIKGVSRFETKVRPHHHVICKMCSTIEDFESENLNKYAIELIKGKTQFKIEHTTMNFLGLCKKCAQQSQK